VAWLHALWLAYRQHKDPEAGLSGLFVWHRDFRTHAVAAIRAPVGTGVHGPVHQPCHPARGGQLLLDDRPHRQPWKNEGAGKDQL
jgi:hypothetical protein